MKKKIPMLCNIVSIILVIAFIVKCISDYDKYTHTFSHVTFTFWIAVNALFLVIPAIIVFVVGLIVKKKQK